MSKTIGGKGDTAIAMAIAVPAGVVILAVWSAWNAVIAKLAWGWFLVPLGVPDISLAHAFGLAIFITWMTTAIPKKTAEGEIWGKIARDLKRDAVVLVFMWGAHFLI